MRAEMMLEVLSAKLEQKEDYIKMLLERIKLLAPEPDITDSAPNTQVLSPTIRTQSVTPQTTQSPVIQVPASIDEENDHISSSFSVHSPESHVKSSYSEVLQTPTPIPNIVRRIATPSIGQNRFKLLQSKHNLSIIYIVALHESKVGQFRKSARESGLSLQSVQNISFIGTSVVELLLESQSVQSFVDQAKSRGYKVQTNVDITSRSDQNPLLLAYPFSRSTLSDLIKSNFVRRISHEIKTCSNERVKQYYLDWAQMMKWKDDLSVSSTSSVSP